MRYVRSAAQQVVERPRAADPKAEVDRECPSLRPALLHLAEDESVAARGVRLLPREPADGAAGRRRRARFAAEIPRQRLVHAGRGEAADRERIDERAVFVERGRPRVDRRAGVRQQLAPERVRGARGDAVI